MKAFVLFIFLMQPQYTGGNEHTIAVSMDKESCIKTAKEITLIKAPIGARCVEVDVYGQAEIIRE